MHYSTFYFILPSQTGKEGTVIFGGTKIKIIWIVSYEHVYILRAWYKFGKYINTHSYLIILQCFTSLIRDSKSNYLKKHYGVRSFISLNTKLVNLAIESLGREAYKIYKSIS